MRIRYIIWAVICCLLYLITSYLNLAFCSVYKNTNREWFISCFISFGIQISLKLFVSLIVSCLRQLVVAYPYTILLKSYKWVVCVCELI